MRAYFPFTFIAENIKYCCIWYSDKEDGFVTESEKVKSFADMNQLISYVVTHNLKIAEETTVLFVDGFTHWLKEPTDFDCGEFLMFWNVITDLAHSSDNEFYGAKNTITLNSIYDKLYIGSQLPTKEEGNSLNQPLWSKNEQAEIVKVIEDGLSILESCLLK
jgi:hypothetical protein